ncbi:ribonuclease H-like domain-containing protein [Tanacetum coccineum]
MNERLKKGSIKEAATLFSVFPRTVRRIWQRAQHQVRHGVTADVSSKMPKVVGRKRVQIDFTQVSQLPLRRRATIRCLAKSIGVPKSTLHRRKKEGDLRPHTNAIKPELTDANKRTRSKLGKLVNSCNSAIVHNGFKQSVMDRSKWMYEIGHSEEAYVKGVLSFLQIAEANRGSRYKSKQQKINNNVNKKQKNKNDENKVETNDNDDAIKIGPPAKQLWYFPIVPRLKQLFANEKDAKLLRWHTEGRKRDGKLRHVADSPQWRKIDNKFDKFGAEIRNIRFGLSSDGPKQPGNDIDVYLAPLIDDMKTLWGSGVEDLEYWEHLYVRHCLDVMHIEKNVAESLIGLLLNIPGKIKDGVNARKDMVSMRIRLELAPKEKGYSANIKKLVSVQDCKLLGMKSHDCHVLMTHMIPIAIRGEIKAIGPVHLHNMYPFERYMGFLKDFLRNQAQPDASIVQGYYSEELIEFASSILKGVENIGILHSRHEGRLLGVGTIGLRAIDPDRDLLEVAHSVVLQHMTCVAPYIKEHMEMFRRINPGRTDKWYQTKYSQQFANWFKDKQDEKSTTQNSRVTIIASTMEFERMTQDARSTIAKMSYYDEEGFTLVDLSTNGYTSDLFVLAKLATQVFFVKNLSKLRWHVVLYGYCKYHKKRAKTGQKRTRERKEYTRDGKVSTKGITRGLQTNTPKREICTKLNAKEAHPPPNDWIASVAIRVLSFHPTATIQDQDSVRNKGPGSKLPRSV